MPNDSRLQIHLIQKVSQWILLGVFIWILVLVTGAAQFRSAPNAHTYDVAIGPVVLNQITRTAVDGGNSVSFSFEPGLAWYFLGWAGVGLLMGLLLVRVDTYIRE